MNRDQTPAIIIGKLMSISGMLQSQGNRMLKPYGLNQQQFSIFFEIAKAGKVKQKDVINRLLLEKAHVSKVVKKLQHMQLITVTEADDDKRSAWLSLTVKGTEVIEQCTGMFHAWNEAWASDIGNDELQSMLDTVASLQVIFKEHTR